MSDIDNDQQDSIFEQAMADEAASGIAAAPEPDDEPITPSEALAATVDSAKADREQAGGEQKPAPAAHPEKVEFTAEEYLRTRERAQTLERELAEIRKQGDKAKDSAAQKAGLFEDPEGWEAQQQAAIDAKVNEAVAGLRTQALNYDLEQTRARVGDEKFSAMDKAVTEAVARDPQFAAQLKALSPYGAGAAIEKWYDSTLAVRDPAAYEARLREKILAEIGQNAPNDPPAGQKPATGADAAGSNVTRLPPSLARQSSARAASSADDGDDSEAAIFRVGMNSRG